MSDTDKDWETLGSADPYFAVLTQKEYHRQNLSDHSVAKFFASGQQHIDFILATIQQHVHSSFHPQRALDFGCGVGRLLLPLASMCQSVVGVDISESMLKEAKKNLDSKNVKNVSLFQSDDQLSQVTGQFDLVHSYIVLQHIPQARGEQIFIRLVDLLSEGGIGVIHVPYLCQHAQFNRLWYWARKSIPLLNGLGNIRRGLPFAYPMIQMNEYNLNRLLQILQDRSCFPLYIYILC